MDAHLQMYIWLMVELRPSTTSRRVRNIDIHSARPRPPRNDTWRPGWIGGLDVFLMLDMLDWPDRVDTLIFHERDERDDRTKISFVLNSIVGLSGLSGRRRDQVVIMQILQRKGKINRTDSMMTFNLMTS